jgi:hypothetical protein
LAAAAPLCVCLGCGFGIVSTTAATAPTSDAARASRNRAFSLSRAAAVCVSSLRCSDFGSRPYPPCRDPCRLRKNGRLPRQRHTRRTGTLLRSEGSADAASMPSPWLHASSRLTSLKSLRTCFIDAPCTHWLMHGDPMHAHKCLTAPLPTPPPRTRPQQLCWDQTRLWCACLNKQNCSKN